MPLPFFNWGQQAAPAPDGSLLLMSEIVLGPVWVWWAYDETPTRATLVGGAIILAAWFGSQRARARMRRCGRAAADECPLGGRTLPDMQPLIGITGEQKPASTLIDVLDVLRTVDIDIFYGDYAGPCSGLAESPCGFRPMPVQRSSNDSMASCSAAATTSIQPSSVRNPTRISATPTRIAMPTNAACSIPLEIDLPVLGVCRVFR